MLKLNPNPVFWSDVSLKIAGEEKPIKVKFCFKHKTIDQYKEFFDKLEGKEDFEVVLDIATDWQGIDAPFNAENVKTLCANYHGIALKLFEVYAEELGKARSKN